MRRFMGESDFLNIAITTLDSARATVQFCPMMSILFVGLRMRALQITDQKGAPQGWAQQGMFLSTYAIMVQVSFSLSQSKTEEFDEDFHHWFSSRERMRRCEIPQFVMEIIS